MLQHGNSKENIKLMKTIMITMIRTQKPIEITGLKFFNLSLQNSAKVQKKKYR